MPHISIAMRNSLRRSVADVMVQSLLRRDQITDAETKVHNVKEAFSSWDNCMQVAYCKWPVIGVIIVGSLFILSIVWCIVRCACCGMSCCCTCFSFLSCCDCCGGLCDGKKNKPMKHLDDPFNRPPASHQGYAAPPPMPSPFASSPFANSPTAAGIGGRPAPPQYAQFDVSKNASGGLSEDALPAMPSWEGANQKRISVREETKEGVELGELDHATGQKVPLIASAAPAGQSGPPSPARELGAPPFGGRPSPGPGPNGNVGYRGVPADPYARRQNNMSPAGRGYGGPPFPPGQGPPGSRGPPGPPGNRGFGPGPGPNNGQGFNGNGFHAELPAPNGPPMDGPYMPPSPQDYHGHDYHDDDGFGAAPGPGFGPGPQGNRPYPNDPNGPRQFPPQPQRQYSDGSRSLTGPGRQYPDQNQGQYPPDQYLNSNGPGPGPMPPQNRGSPGPNGRPGQGPRLNSPTNAGGFDFGENASSRPYYPQRSPPPQQPLPFPPPASQRSSPRPQQARSPPPDQAPQGGGRPGPRSPPPGQMPFDGPQGGPQQGGRSDYNRSPINASRSPPPQNEGQGYQPYSRPQYSPSGSRQGGREPPQNWDPVQR
ncbi:hypothetical protein F5884DRAFT_851351 [Xylogone sp. PMI_703]|nr:hypothetical protein F5884DRAFT_851351 [Xylogone sp. PMI_703]